MIDIKKFKDKYKEYEKTYSYIQKGIMTYDILPQNMRSEFKTLEEFEKEILRLIQSYEASVYMFYNINGSISEKEFEKYYKKVRNASEESKSLYEKVNDRSYSELLAYLDKTSERLNSKQETLGKEIRKGLSKVNKEIEDRKKLKQELIELGIAEDYGDWNVITIKPDKFVEYLKYLEEHFISSI